MPGINFISYSSVDAAEFVFKLADLLDAGSPSISTWIDKKELLPVEDWDKQIVNAIRTCDSLIFVMTPDSIKDSSVCKNEWNQALKFKKPIIPIRLHDEAELPFRLNSRHYIDFRSNFDGGIIALRKYFIWSFTTEGQLQFLKYRLTDAERDLRHASEAERLRIFKEIEELKDEITRLDRIVQNPVTSAAQTQLSVDTRMEGERQPMSHIVKEKRAKFVNPPPMAAPAYFQDRIVETQFITNFLKNESFRMMTLIGRGGVGKTAMVCRLLSSLELGLLPDDLGEFGVGGIVYLSEIGSHRIGFPNLFGDLCRLLPADVASRLEQTYKDGQRPVRSKMFSLLEEFRDKPVVVLLDNMESIMDQETRSLTQEDLREALRAVLEAPHHTVKILVTTRIAPKDILLIQPQYHQSLNLDEGLESPHAENLLRALDADGTVGLKNAPDSVLNTVRIRTRGFPRALEAFYGVLAVDRSTTLDELLSVAEQVLPEYVVEKLVGEAFSRLDRNTQIVMQTLAIFGRPVPAVAIDFVLQPYIPGIDSSPVLNRLVNMHFVRKEMGRYFLHPIDREYALSRVSSAPNSNRNDGESSFDQKSLRQRAAVYFSETRLPRDSWKTIANLSAQLNEFDIRCANEDYEEAISVLLSIDYQYLYIWGHYHLMSELHNQLRGRVRNNYFQQQSLGHLGIALAEIGRIAEATEVTEEALKIAKEAGFGNQASIWLGNLGTFDSDVGNTTQAVNRHKEALVVGIQAGSSWQQAVAFGNLGSCYAELGKINRAEETLKQAVRFAHLSGDIAREAVILAYLAEVFSDANNYAEAKQTAYAAIEIASPSNVQKALILGHKVLALTYLFIGNLTEARKEAESACKFDLPQYKHHCLVLMGLIALRQQDISTAQQFFSEAIAEADKIVAHNQHQFRAWDTKGLALSGLNLVNNQTDFTAAVTAHRTARGIAKDTGIVNRLLRLYKEMGSYDPSGNLAQPCQAAAGNL